MNGKGHGQDDTRFDKRSDLLISFPPTPEISSALEGKPSASAKNKPAPIASPPEPDHATPDISMVFGEPYRLSHKTIIPVASVQILYRPASGSRPIFSRATPIAIIETDDRGVRIKPIVNTRLLVLTWALMLAWTVYWLLRTVREGRVVDRKS